MRSARTLHRARPPCGPWAGGPHSRCPDPGGREGGPSSDSERTARGCWCASKEAQPGNASWRRQMSTTVEVLAGRLRDYPSVAAASGSRRSPYWQHVVRFARMPVAASSATSYVTQIRADLEFCPLPRGSDVRDAASLALESFFEDPDTRERTRSGQPPQPGRASMDRCSGRHAMHPYDS
jgi:hypothetical protein